MRIASNREFFNIPPEKAYEILRDIADMLDDAEIDCPDHDLRVKEYRKPKVAQKTKKVVNKLFNFYSIGLKDGDEVIFCGLENDYSNIATVVNSRQVEFEGKIWYLSGLALELFTRLGIANNSGAYQGPRFFTYNGVRLIEMKIIDQPEDEVKN